MTVIKWAYRHHSLQADTFDTLDEAVASAYWGGEYGEEALECVEVINDDGTTEVHDEKAVEALAAPLRQKADEEWRARPTPTVILDIRAPNGDWAAYENFVAQDAAEAAASNARALLGADRVRLRPYGRRS